MKRKTYDIGDKVYVIDRVNVFGREVLVIEPGKIKRCYIGDSDFRGDYLVQLEYNKESIGAYHNNLIPID